jgi:hypothetical protein
VKNIISATENDSLLIYEFNVTVPTLLQCEDYPLEDTILNFCHKVFI